MAPLILVRHGNTFASGQPAVWIGARTDLPLTATGEEQARMAGAYILRNFGLPEAVIAGPLQRTRRTAKLIAGNSPVMIDNRLREIDYGLWEGLTGADIAARYGADILAAWEERQSWPEAMQWQPPQAELERHLGEFLAEQHRQTGLTVAVTSNGILRLIHRLIGAGGGTAKVRTGHLCVLERARDGWKVVGWDVGE